jgi:hypothetical protein
MPDAEGGKKFARIPHDPFLREFSFSKRRNDAPETVTARPVAGTSMKGPWCVPWVCQWIATRSPSSTICRISTVESGNAVCMSLMVPWRLAKSSVPDLDRRM